jgi:hypothetical protein
MVLIPFPYKNVYSPADSVPLPSHLIYYIPIKSNLYLYSFHQTAIREPTLCKLLIFQGLF